MEDWNGNSKSIFVCNGASNHTEDERQTDDYYATEPKAIELLTELVDIDKNVWECACGEGHLAKVLEEKGHNVKATDLVDRGYGQGGIDFLAYDGKFNGDIVTNPPYKYAKEFVEKALDVVEDGNKVMMFLKLTFLEGKARKKLFMATPPPEKFSYLLPDFNVLKMEILKHIAKVAERRLLMLGTFGRKATMGKLL